MIKNKIVFIFSLFGVLTLSACANVPADAAPTMDVVGTTAAELARMMLTQTAGAVTPTPFPPTETPLPSFTETPTLEPTIAVTAIPMISRDTGCYDGPGTNRTLVTNIVVTEQVEVVGISSVPGWYVIRNPIYGSLCWVPQDALELAPDFDLTSLEVIP